MQVRACVFNDDQEHSQPAPAVLLICGGVQSPAHLAPAPVRWGPFLQSGLFGDLPPTPLRTTPDLLRFSSLGLGLGLGLPGAPAQQQHHHPSGVPGSGAHGAPSLLPTSVVDSAACAVTVVSWCSASGRSAIMYQVRVWKVEGRRVGTCGFGSFRRGSPTDTCPLHR